MNEFLESIKNTENTQSFEQDYRKREEHEKLIRNMHTVLDCLKSGYMQATEEQWKMIDTLVDQLYRRHPAREDESR